ncbi:hypothetical protein APC42_17800 [Acinetobacter pittii]|uniref:hypothetical protein n=1 Tax=Acinetobacter calcoaceticus/baumannii complex TaxID=909768 RepID=UPI00070A9D42|nr:MULTISPECIES: hypothetical protein [Acinetobacter calcoaceticus/baumannii complex]ELA7052273.1 hypothetical protein [Acinetobacter baumannii]KRI49452.1 hypothetical protein APC42_17800 [Acinetobacter pittii]OBM17257.1 hypothetical protein A9933_07115 [Acinetobacter baumannii]
MLEEISKQRPEGATHWQAGVYYRLSKYGVWAKWDKSWITCFKWPDGVMTPLLGNDEVREAGVNHE